MQEIINVEKNKHYFAMSNYHLEDTRLSIQAKGLLTLFLSLPDDWEFSMEELKGMMREEEASIDKIIVELTAAGYFKSVVIRDEKGRIIKREYFVYEKAHTGKTA